MSNRLDKLTKVLTQLGYKEEVALLGTFISKASNKYHIKSGDSLWKLSGGDAQYKKIIEDANPNTDWDNLQIGEEVILPEKPDYPNKNMNPSTSLIEFIKKHETFSSKLYDDGFGNMTIGYGHKVSKDEGLKQITKEQAEKILSVDVKIASDFIKRNISKKLTQFQFDALVSLVFNAGGSAFYKSDLFKAIDSGNFAAAHKLFPTTLIGTNQGGVQKRRVEEAAMFKGGIGTY